MSCELLIDMPRPDVAVLRINRPRWRNACDQPTWQAIADAFDALSENPAVRAAVVTGSGGHFSAGDDIIAYNKAKADARAAEKHRASIRNAYDAMLRTPFPVVAALCGACVGGAASLAMCCDFRVADHTARLCIPVARLCLVYPSQHVSRLVHLVGASTARRWLYSGEFIDAERMRETGFVEMLVDGDVVQAAIDFTRPMLTAAPLSIKGSKMQINAICSDTLADITEEIERQMTQIESSHDYQEAIRAFRNKTAPQFIGR